MTHIISAPEHGEEIISGQGKAKPNLQRYFDDIVFFINADRTELQSYTVATLPPAASGYGMIMVTDESGGAVPAFSDLTNWRRTTDRAVVS